MKCPQCGASISRQESQCSYCGWWTPVTAPQTPPTPPPPQVRTVYVQAEPQTVVHERVVYVHHSNKSPKRRAVALLLCLFFGVFGIHKFYQGRIGLGILYLLTGGFLAIGVFFDLLRLLFGHPVDGKGRVMDW